MEPIDAWDDVDHAKLPKVSNDKLISLCESYQFKDLPLFEIHSGLKIFDYLAYLFRSHHLQ